MLDKGGRGLQFQFGADAIGNNRNAGTLKIIWQCILKKELEIQRCLKCPALASFLVRFDI